MIKDNKLYTFDYYSGQLKVPETLPEVQKLNGNHWGIENATRDFQNSTKAGAYDCNLPRDGELFCDQYMHAYDITWNKLQQEARNKHIIELMKKDKGFQEMLK